MPEATVIKQRQDMVNSHRTLKAEGFPEIVFSDNLYRLLPYLERLSEARTADLGLDDSDGLGDLLLVRRTFGEEILPLWRWKPGSNTAGGDRVAEIRLGQQYLTLALRTDVDGEGDIGFDVMVPCPHDDECTGRAWCPPTASPACSAPSTATWTPTRTSSAPSTARTPTLRQWTTRRPRRPRSAGPRSDPRLTDTPCRPDTTGGIYDPEADAVVQDELGADADRERVKQLEADNACRRRKPKPPAAPPSLPTCCVTPCCAPSPAPACWTG
ncbi:hypothetical protein ACWGH3_02795 [Streptomyces sp. NPDC054884]|uniref:hypothetical protein n=1 Tax=Streptomyces sp. ME08-AFT2 TaxID=3028683 RepID=UPI0029C06D0E|nr:hypothetical protein [Streptomyces sp. ME08-AFT2]